MATGFLHSHVLIVTIFLLFLLFKTVLLLANRKELLAKVRTRFKVADPILGTLMLATGGYLLYLQGANAPIYLWVKLIVVVIIIPIGIIAFKKENKLMATIALLLTFYIYGVSETSSLSFSKNDENTADVIFDEPPVETEITEQLIANGKEVYLAECKRCHGVDGKKGMYKAPDLSKSELSLEQRIAWIKQGKGRMPAYEDELSSDEIIAVSAYLDELK